MQKGATNLNNQQQQTSTSSNNSAKVKCNMLFTIFGDNDKMLIDFFDSIKNKAVLEKSRPSNSAINPIIHVAMDQKSLLETVRFYQQKQILTHDNQNCVLLRLVLLQRCPAWLRPR